MAKKTLNEHLFEQLERLSDADENTIKLEVQKAMHIISISEQVLNVARLKLDILAAGEGIVNQFGEIDTAPLKQLEDDKKKE
jgi:hypothetical protein